MHDSAEKCHVNPPFTSPSIRHCPLSLFLPTNNPQIWAYVVLTDSQRKYIIKHFFIYFGSIFTYFTVNFPGFPFCMLNPSSFSLILSFFFTDSIGVLIICSIYSKAGLGTNLYTSVRFR